ncbi:MAG TPA: PDZ domain-containing protein [Vicinamibacterales bacterium]
MPPAAALPSKALRVAVVGALWLTSAAAHALAQAPVSYTLSFPERAHRLMHVQATFTEVPAGPLQLRMSRSSPGRYAAHEFAKNVFDVAISDGAGQPLAFTRPNPHQWDVPQHGDTVRVTYRVFGDRIDGTYLAVDASHAHINMPAALMWARGFVERPVQVRFEPPAGLNWRVATQLFPGGDPFTFTAPNLMYAMDSPSEFGAFDLRTFTVQDGPRKPEFRVAIHHQGDAGELDSFVRDIEKIVREARHVFGEYAPFEGNAYTFIADYLPWANSDGMEHRNSTVITSGSSIRTSRVDLLATVSHEFFHSWNVERIRPASLEPFSLDDANISGELWLAEGFTSYYEPLVTTRAGLTNVREFAQEMGRVVNAVLTGPGRQVRTVEQMSQFAAFTDAATAIDRTNFDNTFISYYTWGEAIGLGLDLSLRERSNGRVTLDAFMRALWRMHGKPGGRVPGQVEKPYTVDDLKRALAEVAGDASFAADFFKRFIQGHDVVDYQALLGRAGFVLRPLAGSGAYIGNLRLEDASGGVRLAAPTPMGSPAYDAGLDREDLIVALGGVAVSSEADLRRLVAQRKPGDELPIAFERRGARVSSTIRLISDPRREVVPVEDAGQTLTAAQRRFRDDWLGSAGR